MKKEITTVLFSAIISLMMVQQVQVFASESTGNFNVISDNSVMSSDHSAVGVDSNIISVSDNTVSVSNNDILLETETSVVINRHMQPAERMREEKEVYPNPLNPYKTTKVPAQITKQGSYYFIVDTYHNQVIYSDKLETPITKWNVMTSKLDGPHSITSDGKYYLVADTENNRVLIFEWIRGGFRLTQKIEGMGIRPHYVDYDRESDCFYVWSSQTCEMYILTKGENETICIKEIRKLKDLEGHYIRSFVISGNYIIFPSGTNKQVLITDKNSLQILERCPVSDEIAGMAYIRPIDNYFYMTVSTDANFDQSKATIIRAKDLHGLIRGEYEDISSAFPKIRVPYYIDYMQGAYYMTNHGSSNSVFRFQIINDEINNIRPLEF